MYVCTYVCMYVLPGCMVNNVWCELCIDFLGETLFQSFCAGFWLTFNHLLLRQLYALIYYYVYCVFGGWLCSARTL